MKDISSLTRRLKRITPNPVSQSEIEEAEAARLWMQLYKEFLPRRLEECKCGDLIDEMLVALESVTRPFDHMRMGDRPVWSVIDEIADRHPDLRDSITAAELSAGADALVALGGSEDDETVRKFRKSAAGALERVRKEKQTVCDQCGSDLDGWSCHSWTRDGRDLKLCRTCSEHAVGKHHKSGT